MISSTIDCLQCWVLITPQVLFDACFASPSGSTFPAISLLYETYRKQTLTSFSRPIQVSASRELILPQLYFATWVDNDILK